MKRFTLVLLFVSSFVTAHGEEDNPTKLSLARLDSFSIVQAGYTYQQGGFGVIGLPRSTNTYTVSAKSHQRLGQTSLYGLLSYAMNHRREQSWNSMSGEAWSSVNLSDSLPGRQRAEKYHLVGGFSLPLHHRWTIGAAADYQVKLTAKETDPRNRNQWIEWQFTPSVSYRAGTLDWGVSLCYAASQESVGIRNIGQHQAYPIFAAYPLSFFQTLSQEEEVNWHYAARQMGVAWQMLLARGDTQLFQQLSANILHQQIESNRILNQREGETDGWKTTYTGTLQRQQGNTCHEWKAEASLHHTRSYDPLQRQANGGVWQTDERVLRSTRQTVDAAWSYRYCQKYHTTHPRHTWVVGMNYHQAKSTLLFYPTEYSQPLHQFTFHTTFDHRVLLSKGVMLHFSIGVHGQAGGGTVLHKRLSSAEQGAPEISLWDNTTLRQQMFDYQTGQRWGVTPTVGYTRPLSQRLSGSWFIRLKVAYEQVRKLPRSHGEEIVAQMGWLF